MILNKTKNKYTKGATLLEMMVVISIFLVISGVTVFNYGQFNSSMSTQNLVDDIALSVRRAQSYAIGVRGVNDKFIGGYGVHFSPRILVPGDEHWGSNKSFVMFAEMGTTINMRYDFGAYDGCGSPTTNDECMEILKITSADEISSIKLYGAGGVLIRDMGSAGYLDILFYRPNPEPIFCYRTSMTNSDCDENEDDIVYALIDVSSSKGGVTTTRSIKISNSGQISVAE